jgi:hypothetical protein
MSQEGIRAPSPHDKRTWMHAVGIKDKSLVQINFGFGLEETYYRGISRNGDLRVSGSRSSRVVAIESGRITLLQP